MAAHPVWIAAVEARPAPIFTGDREAQNRSHQEAPITVPSTGPLPSRPSSAVSGWEQGESPTPAGIHRGVNPGFSSPTQRIQEVQEAARLSARAVAAENQGAFADALTLWQEVQRKFPEDPLTLKRIQQCAAHLNHSVNDAARERFMEASRLLQGGEFEQAISILESLPNDLSWYDEVGGLLDKALRQIRSLGPAGVLARQAIALADRGDIDGAAQTAREAAAVGCSELELRQVRVRIAAATVRRAASAPSAPDALRTAFIEVQRVETLVGPALAAPLHPLLLDALHAKVTALIASNRLGEAIDILEEARRYGLSALTLRPFLEELGNSVGIALYARSSAHRRAHAFQVGAALLAASSLIWAAVAYWPRGERSPQPDPTTVLRGGCVRQAPENDTHPPVEVCAPGLRIDRYEVSQAAYDRCVQAGRCPAARRTPSTEQGSPSRQTDAETLPVTGVDRSGAEAYCGWQSKRLPTADELEYAALLGEGAATASITPRAVTPTASANLCGVECDPALAFGPTRYSDPFPSLAPRNGGQPDASGVFFLYGNVAEWTQTQGREPHTTVVHGGSWATDFLQKRGQLRVDVADGLRSHALGFRCVARLATGGPR